MEQTKPETDLLGSEVQDRRGCRRLVNTAKERDRVLMFAQAEEVAVRLAGLTVRAAIVLVQSAVGFEVTGGTVRGVCESLGIQLRKAGKRSSAISQPSVAPHMDLAIENLAKAFVALFGRVRRLETYLDVPECGPSHFDDGLFVKVAPLSKFSRDDLAAIIGADAAPRAPLAAASGCRPPAKPYAAPTPPEGC